MKIEFEFDYPMKEFEFRTQSEYAAYKARCREDQLGAQVHRLKIKASREGLTEGAWVRILLRLAREACMEMP